MVDLKKQPEENERQYIWRIGQYIKSGQVESWKAVAPIINEQCRSDISEYRDESAYRKPFQYAEGFYEDVFSKMIDEDYSKQIAHEKNELYKERIKLQTEKLEISRWNRESARNELIIEKVINAVSSLPPIPVPEKVYHLPNRREYCLLFGDEHSSAEFEIKGLHNEILNAYSPEIFEQRMWDLLDQTVDYIAEKDITDLNVFSMGDSTDGLLRVGQLMKLRYGVIEGAVYYADFISTWLNELSKYVNINYQMVYGNHTELRMLGQPKGAFKDDNTGLFIREIIRLRLKDNPNFTMTENPTGLIFQNVCGFNILGIHGEVKDLEKAIVEKVNSRITTK